MKVRADSATGKDYRVWPLATFVLPFLVLVGIGAFGVWRERTTGTADLQRSLAWHADSAAKSAGMILEQEMAAWAWAEARVGADGRVSGRTWFSQTPLPNVETEAFRAFTEGRFEDVIELHPGVLSPGGIPLGPMAAFRRLLLAPDEGVALQAARKVRELAFAFPSVISPELLDGAEAELNKRGLVDPNAEPWRERWSRLERVARALEVLLEAPLPSSGTYVRDLIGESWLIDVSTRSESHLIRIVPLANAIRSIKEEWQGIPLGNGMFLALTSPDSDLVPRPADSEGWAQEVVALNSGGLQVLALGDPATAARTIRLRIVVLGGVGLLAGVMVSMAWWRQQSAVRLQQELARQKDDFLSTVSHELRTPVASMQLLAENLATGAFSNPAVVADYHQRLLREARRLASTTEHLLDFSLMERGQKAFRFAQLNPQILADEVRTVILPIAASKGIELTMEVLPIVPPPLADEDGVRRIVLNLADNAIKYSPPSGHVEIRIEPEPAGQWSIRVRDHGPGIPAHEQSKIFDRFFRGGAVLDRPTRGTGIGLAVARHIAECHGGKLVLTESSSAGSVFTCSLPIQPTISLSSHENTAD